MPALRRKSGVGDYGAVVSIQRRVTDYGGKKSAGGDGDKADKPATETKEAGSKEKDSASTEAASKDTKESKEKKPAKKK